MSPLNRSWWARRVLGGLPLPVLVGGALAVFGLSAVVVRANGERASLGAAADTTLLTIPTSGPATSEPAPTTAPAATDAPTTPATPATSASTEPAATTEPATTAAPPTTAPATTAPPATTAAPVVEDTTVAPTTVATTPLTTAPADGRIVEINSRVGSCSFGSNCLIAGFKLVGFRNADTFVCIFGDGSRATFRMRATEVRTACSTSRTPDSITIEVDGVRSETVTR